MSGHTIYGVGCRGRVEATVLEVRYGEHHRTLMHKRQKRVKNRSFEDNRQDWYTGCGEISHNVVLLAIPKDAMQISSAAFGGNIREGSS